MNISFVNLLKDITSTTKTATPPSADESLFVEGNLDKALKIEDLKLRREVYDLAVQNRKERKKYAKHIFTVTCIWGTLIFLILIASGLKSIAGKQYFMFTLSDKVMITLITSTTINFFGFFLLVVKYLFHITPPEKISTPIKRRTKTEPETK